MDYIYLDYAASAPLRPEARDAWLSYHELPCSVANPNSLHTLGREAARKLDGARATLARCLDCGFRPSEMLLTSGGTESNNLAVLGMTEGARRRDRSRSRVVLSAIEHDSVLDVASLLRGRGFEVELARPGRDGVVSPEEVRRAAGEHCALVSVMAANNETGVVQPTAGIVEAAHAAGALVHVDAVQAFGRIPVDARRADAISVAAHKIGGPLGVGALAMRTRCPFEAQSLGGGQELGRRPGTQDVAGAVAFAAAAELVCSNLGETRARVASLASHVYGRLCAEGTGIVPTTSVVVDEGRLPGMVSVMVPGLDSETLVLQLDARGFEVSAGSACSSGSLDPSHVLSAMGIPRDEALGSLRVSFDERVALSELDAFCDALLAVVGELR
ncbi:cysteine desulfurase family protein [uncultured Parolsenella sp.]|uniref:cysteine desulfurase family protein n=1 Tax=uncultured Parolsenella sp. TaxID=2083008 RepID=UPI0025EA4273|nr:cysteine desulfurase family protein [uncultured Parolsenella sp.]